MTIKPKPNTQGPGTTGHQWDGIKELNNPLPRWWLWTFYATIVFAIGYCIAYPAWPLLTHATPGLLGASTRAEELSSVNTISFCDHRASSCGEKTGFSGATNGSGLDSAVGAFGLVKICVPLSSITGVGSTRV